ncbi:MAG TPA: hypothetical protein VF791_10380 [Pyrinomonadaceae bacterium]
MKRCPSCNRTYDDAMNFCPTDATPLISDAPQAYDPAKTVVASPPPSAPPPTPEGNVPPTQALGTGAPPVYQQPYEQPQQPAYQQPPQQWAPQPPPQQWGAPLPRRSNNKIFILALVGLLLAGGAGLLIYFLTRSDSSSSTSSSSNSSGTSSSNSFVGTWKPAADSGLRGDFDTVTINSDGTYSVRTARGNKTHTGKYTIAGGKLTFDGEFGDEVKSNGAEIVMEGARMLWRVGTKSYYFDKS